MRTRLFISKEESKVIYDKATEICKELHKIFPYCVIDCHFREDLLYQFNIDFSYLNDRIDINAYIDYKMMLTGIPEPDLLARMMYDSYIIPRITRVKMEMEGKK